MSDTQTASIDHSADEKLPELPPVVEPEPPVAAEPPAEPRDPSINDPPEPVEVTDEVLAHVHKVSAEIVALIERIAALVPAGHSLAVPIGNIKLSLETLWAMAHDPK